MLAYFTFQKYASFLSYFSYEPDILLSEVAFAIFPLSNYLFILYAKSFLLYQLKKHLL